MFGAPGRGGGDERGRRRGGRGGGNRRHTGGRGGGEEIQIKERKPKILKEWLKVEISIQIEVAFKVTLEVKIGFAEVEVGIAPLSLRVTSLALGLAEAFEVALEVGFPLSLAALALRIAGQVALGIAGLEIGLCPLQVGLALGQRLGKEQKRLSYEPFGLGVRLSVTKERRIQYFLCYE